MFKKTIVIVALCCMTAIFAEESGKALPQVVDDSNIKPTSISPITTVKPPSTTTPSATTTPAPPPTPPSTTTTTTSTPPTTTTTIKTTTTAKPTPSPIPPVNPTQGKWSINDTITNKTCIMLEMAIQFDIIIKDNNRSSKVHINVPSNATATGDCRNNSTQSITLKWSPVINVTDFIAFNFTKTNTSGFDLFEITAKLNVSLPGKDAQVFNLNHKKNEFVTPLHKSYKCYKEQALNLTVKNMIGVASVLKISQVQMEAFHNNTDSNFSDAMDCMGSETPDVVPIAVGCALAALVIIVLIVYLMGRRRSQARGYLSM